MKKQSIWVFQWRKSVHYWWSYMLFSPECKELTSMLDPLLYRWGVPPDVIRCVHWTMQMWVLQTWIKALGLYIVMCYMCSAGSFLSLFTQNTCHLAYCVLRHRQNMLTYPSNTRWRDVSANGDPLFCLVCICLTKLQVVTGLSLTCDVKFDSYGRRCVSLHWAPFH